MRRLRPACQEGTVLLECLSNLTANEFYDRLGEENSTEGSFFSEEFVKSVTDLLVREVLSLRSRCRNLVVVTNEVFSDGILYDPETESYIRILGAVNRRLAREADRVTEVVCGLPQTVKPAEEQGTYRKR